MEARPIKRELANRFIKENHRHHGPVVGDLFRTGAFWQGSLVAVACAGRPSARHLDDGFTVEVTRCCTQGFHNAASFLYGRILKAAAAIGYREAITYTLYSEPGTSLNASGWRKVALTRGGSWDRPARARTDKAPTVPKMRWQRTLGDQRLPPSSTKQADLKGAT